MRYQTKHGFYELNSFPGCSQLVVSNHAFIEKNSRGKGHGKQAHADRLNQIQEMGYDYVICTVNKTDMAQEAILSRFGWRALDGFENRETGHQVGIWGRSIFYPYTTDHPGEHCSCTSCQAVRQSLLPSERGRKIGCGYPDYCACDNCHDCNVQRS